MRILYIDTVATAESETERRETREDDVDDKQNSNLQCALLYAAAALALLGLEPSRGSLRAVYPFGTRALTAQLIANPTAPVARRALPGSTTSYDGSLMAQSTKQCCGTRANRGAGCTHSGRGGRSCGRHIWGWAQMRCRGEARD